MAAACRVGFRRGRHLWRTWSGTRPEQTSRRVAAAAARTERERERDANGARRVARGLELRVLGSGRAQPESVAVDAAAAMGAARRLAGGDSVSRRAGGAGGGGGKWMSLSWRVGRAAGRAGPRKRKNKGYSI